MMIRATLSLGIGSLAMLCAVQTARAQNCTQTDFTNQCNHSGLNDTRTDSATAIMFRAHFSDDDTNNTDYFTGTDAAACVDAAADAFTAFHLYTFHNPYQVDVDSTGVFEIYAYDMAAAGTSCAPAQAWAECFGVNAPTYVFGSGTPLASTTTHELFHTVQRRYMCSVPVDCSDNNVSVSGTFGDWVAEGQAKMMEDHVTPALDQYTGGFYGRVAGANSPLTSPQTSLVDLSYSACLFWKYCCEQYSSVTAEPYAGIDFVRGFWDEVDATGTNASLAHLNNAIVAGGGESLTDAWQNYAICNYTKLYDVSALPDSSKWYYVDENQYGEGTYGTVTRNTLVTGVEILNPTQSAYSIRYYEKDFNTPTECVAVGVSGNSTSGIGWAMIGVNRTTGEALTFSRQTGTDYNRVVLASPSNGIDRIGVIVATLSKDTNHNILFDTGGLMLTVNSPTTNQPGYPGLASDPGRFLIRVLVEGPAGLTPAGPDSLSVAGLDASDFLVTVGGLPGSVYSAGYVGGEYWLVVQAPMQPVDGNYDFTVSLCDGAASNTIANGVGYGNILVNHVVVIDTSGSMSEPPTGMTKLDAVKNAASMYIDAVPEDDNFGVVYFSGNGSECDDDATILAGLGPATSAKRSLANFFIGLLTAGGNTSIGDGLWMAQDEIDAATTGDIDSIILLSDGNENEGRLWDQPNPVCPGSEGPVRDRFLTDDTLINTLSFGREANQSMMQDIANDTGGVHDYIPVEGTTLRATTDLTMANRLAEAYIGALAASRDAEIVFGGSGTASGPFTDVIIPITEGGLVDVEFIFNIDNDAAMLNVELHDPLGALVVDPNDATIFSSDTHATIHLKNTPVTGNWRARLYVTESAQYLTAVIGANRHGAELEFGFSQHRTGGGDGIPERSLFEQGVPVQFIGMLTDQAGPILGANISARVELPNGRIACGNYTLRDDGKSTDGEADDGVYAALFTQTWQGARDGVDNDDQPGGWDPNSGNPGCYTVTLTASGITHTGDQFTRRLITSFFILESLEDGDFDGMPDTWELYYKTLEDVPDAMADFDQDGLNNTDEFRYGTNPRDPDTDGDGEADGSEATGGRCPLDTEDGLLPYPLDVDVIMAPDPNEDETTPVPAESLIVRFPWVPSYGRMRIFRAVDAPMGFTLHATLLPPAGIRGTYLDSGLDAGHRYFYKLQAETPGGARSRFSRMVSGVPAPPPPCPGDLNGDGVVDLTDLALLLSDFDCTGGGCSGDVDGDGDTDLTDLAVLLSNFDTACS